MSTVRTGASKVCRLCGVDCAGRQRVRDQFGRYYCKACYSAEEARGRAAPSKPADPSATGTLMGLRHDHPESGPQAGHAPAGGPARGHARVDEIPVDDGTIPLAPDERPATPRRPHAPPTERFAPPEPEAVDLCPDCGAPVGRTQRVCAACGFDREAGVPVGAHSGHAAAPPATCSSCGHSLAGIRGTVCPECGKDNRVGGAAPAACRKCGRDIRGQKSARCPGCGAVNARRTRLTRERYALQTHRRAYVLPSVVLGLCLPGSVLGAWLVGGANVSVPAFGLTVVAGLVACVVAYLAMIVGWLGVGEPLHLAAIRMGAVTTAADVSRLLVLGTPMGLFIGVGIGLVVFALMAVWLLDLDMDECGLVVVLMGGVKIAATVGGYAAAYFLGW
jgi:hypothetical protein